MTVHRDLLLGLPLLHISQVLPPTAEIPGKTKVSAVVLRFIHHFSIATTHDSRYSKRMKYMISLRAGALLLAVLLLSSTGVCREGVYDPNPNGARDEALASFRRNY